MRIVWGFKETESNAKTGLHPAQFSAVLPMRLVKLYSFVNELVLDPFVGTGTTLDESMKLRRFSMGVDINPEFLCIAERRIQGDFSESRPDESRCSNYKPLLLHGDVGNLARARVDINVCGDVG